MGFLTDAGRCIVASLNMLFLMVSLILITAGAIAYKASEVSFLKDIEDTIKSSLNTLSSNVGGTNTGVNSFSITEFLGGLALALIISGVVLLILSFFGCCGACYKFKTLIFIYVIIISTLFIAQVTVVVLMYAVPSTIQGSIKDLLVKTLENFTGLEGTDVTTLSWMFVMQEIIYILFLLAYVKLSPVMKCCGVNGYTDFSNSNTPDWIRTPGNVTVLIDAPLVCCKTTPASESASDVKCALQATLDINEKGCFDAVWDKVLGNPLWAAVGFGSVFVFQLLLIIFSILILTDKKNKKVYPKG